MKKSQVRSKVLQSVIHAEVSKGHLKWKVSDIARQAGVSRPLIYYYFGKTKIEILRQCLTVVAEEYYGLSPESEKFVREGNLLKSLMKTRQMFLANPSLAVFYQKWRMQSSDIGKQLQEIENRYQAKLKNVFPHLNQQQIIAVHGIFHGLIISPFLTARSLKEAFEMIEYIFTPKSER